MVDSYYRDTVAEIDLDAIGHNVRAFRDWLPERTRFMAVVKANAYGHGAEPVARVALANGASYLGVATLDEAIELQEADLDVPILVMGYIPEHGLDEAISRGIRMAVYHPDHLQQIMEAAAKGNKQAILHLKAETGMNRVGARPGEMSALVRQARDSAYIHLEGLFTHFACADERDKTHTHRQHALFTQILKECQNLGVSFPIVHCGNSATAIDLPQYGYNMVRVGISMYGFYPSPEVQKTNVHLKPAMTLKTRIVHVKKVPPGTSVSYGATYRTQQEETIATLPIGYADGLNRRLSNRGSALVHGRRVPIIGRICMDQTMLALPAELEAEMGDEAVLYGRQGDEMIHIDEVASLLGTISYEITCSVSRRIPRIYKQGDRLVKVRVDRSCAIDPPRKKS